MEYKIGKELENILYQINECIGYSHEETKATDEDMINTLEDIRYKIRELIENN